MLPEIQAIEFPGRVDNPEKALETLGGMAKISQILSKKEQRMELHFNPDNIYDKPTYGERRKTFSYLIKVVVYRKKNPDDPPKYQIQYMGPVTTVYCFDNLADFQYLPIFKDKLSGQITNACDSGLIPKTPLDTKCLDNPNAEKMIIPKSFSRIDSGDVVHGFYRPETGNDGLLTTLGTVNKVVYDSTNGVAFDLVKPFPVSADPEIIKMLKVKYVSNDEFARIKELFDKCPIWTKVALQHESGISADKLKILVPAFAFYLTSGPWRTLFVRFGYDPRKDFNSRSYQIFDYRLRFRSGIAQFIAVRREKMRKQGANITGLTHDINYPYLTADKLPRSRQCMFRYCDIRLPEVQELLRSMPTPAPDVSCDEKNGWLPTGFDAHVRVIVQETAKNLLIDQQQSKDSEVGDSIEVDCGLGNEEYDEDYDSEDEDDEGESNIFDDNASENNSKIREANGNESDDSSTNLDEFIDEFIRVT